MKEFELIDKYFAPLSGKGAFALQDDVALIGTKLAHDLVVSKDAIIESVHFFSEDSAFDVARKLLRVNLSDLAAKGAIAYGYMLGLMVPAGIEESWIANFARGLAVDQQQFNIQLLGGDSCCGSRDICLTATIFGHVADGKILRRNGAAVGDLIYVSGTIGDARLGLDCRLHGVHGEGDVADFQEYLQQRYLLPQPRLELGQKLVNVASACVDISDGLLADAAHIAACSSVGMAIELEQIPLSNAAAAVVAKYPKQYYEIMHKLLSGGDDYELLFTVPAEYESKVLDIARICDVQISKIGIVDNECGVRVYSQSECLNYTAKGWDHFANSN